MPHDQPALHLLVLHDGRADLTVHFANRRVGGLKIVGRVGEPRREGVVGIFHVGQIDVNQSVQLFQRLDAFVAAAIVDHGDGKLRRQGRENRRQKVRRRDQIDTLRALIDQCFKYFPQPCGGKCVAETAPRYVAVLAIAAPQRAAAEKDRSRPEAGGDRRLLSVMEHLSRDDRPVGHGAEAALPFRAVDAAAPRAETAIFIAQQSITLLLCLLKYDTI